MRRDSPFLRATALGLIGIIALVAFIEPIAGIPRIVLAIQPFILLLLFSWLGAWAAPKAGLRSAILLGDAFDKAVAIKTLLFAIAIGAILAVLDHLSIPIWRPEAASGLNSLAESASIKSLISGIAYGGITEEIMLRWGIMSALMVGAMKLMPRNASAMVAIAIASLLFAAGHLPALIATGIELETALLARILVLNAGLGAWFGWIYYRSNLEAAILAHAGFHVGVNLLGMMWI